jgi:transcriptional regulator with XRE-family HTH domain
MQVKVEILAPGLGTELKRARRSDPKQRTAAKIAEEAGISRAYLYDLENEKFSITEPLLKKLGEILEYDFGIEVEVKNKWEKQC